MHIPSHIGEDKPRRFLGQMRVVPRTRGLRWRELSARASSRRTGSENSQHPFPLGNLKEAKAAVRWAARMAKAPSLPPPSLEVMRVAFANTTTLLSRSCRFPWRNAFTTPKPVVMRVTVDSLGVHMHCEPVSLHGCRHRFDGDSGCNDKTAQRGS